MAAIFYQYNPDKSIFKGGLHVNTTIRVPFLNALVGTNGLAIINEVSVSNSDTVQYFMSFDDLISYFYFGKGLGSITISGTMFTNCDGYAPGVDIFYNQIARFRGKEVPISFGNAVFTGVINSFQTSAQAEPAGTIEFAIGLTIINHTLPVTTFTPLC